MKLNTASLGVNIHTALGSKHMSHQAKALYLYLASDQSSKTWYAFLELVVSLHNNFAYPVDLAISQAAIDVESIDGSSSAVLSNLLLSLTTSDILTLYRYAKENIAEGEGLI